MAAAVDSILDQNPEQRRRDALDVWTDVVDSPDIEVPIDPACPSRPLHLPARACKVPGPGLCYLDL